MSEPIPDEVCIAAIDLVLKPLGSQLRHYMPGPKAGAVEAMRGVLQAQRDHDADSIREAVDALALASSTDAQESAQKNAGAPERDRQGI